MLLIESTSSSLNSDPSWPKYTCTLRIVAASVCFAMLPNAFSATIYGGTFDYKRYRPSNLYFAGRSENEIAKFCKSLPHASQEDMDQCAHREFEQVNKEMKEKVLSISSKIKNNDLSLSSQNLPRALPYFHRSQKAWIQYRDNECYSYTYQIGEASIRYQDFWGCMTRITKRHIDELSKSDADD